MTQFVSFVSRSILEGLLFKAKVNNNTDVSSLFERELYWRESFFGEGEVLLSHPAVFGGGDRADSICTSDTARIERHNRG